MNIRWSNLAAFALAIVAFALLVRYRRVLGAFLSSIERIGPGHAPQDQAFGLLALGMIGLCLVAIVRLLTRNDRK